MPVGKDISLRNACQSNTSWENASWPKCLSIKWCRLNACWQFFYWPKCLSYKCRSVNLLSIKLVCQMPLGQNAGWPNAVWPNAGRPNAGRPVCFLSKDVEPLWYIIFHNRAILIQNSRNDSESYLANIAVHCIALHSIVLHCTSFHCTALHCIPLYCTALHSIEFHHIAFYFFADFILIF